jgi:hypothetical protein
MFDDFPSRHGADEGKEWRAREKVTGVVRGVENSRTSSIVGYGIQSGFYRR